MRKLNTDFNLHLPINGETKVNADDLSRLKERVKQAQELRAAEEAWDNEYSRLMDEYCALDKTILFSTDETEVAQARERIIYIIYCLNTMPARPQ